MNAIYKVVDGDKFYYAGFEYANNTHNCSWSLYQPILIPDDELEDCIRDIRESYTGELFTVEFVERNTITYKGE